MMASSEPKRLMGWLGHHPLRTLLRIAATVLGVTATLWLLGAIWPEPDRVAPGAALSEDDPTSLAAHPLVPVTVLLVGIDSDQVGDLLNQAAPKGGANADALMLLRIDASTSLEVLQIPIELAVQLPGAGEPSTLASLWRGGGVALASLGLFRALWALFWSLALQLLSFLTRVLRNFSSSQPCTEVFRFMLHTPSTHS